MEFDLRARTILLTISGSRSYGLHTAESDIDIKGVVIPPKEFYFGVLRNFEHATADEEIAVYKDVLSKEEREVADKNGFEGTSYELTKFMGYALKFNPNIVESLFCRDQEVRICSKFGEMLRANREAFISLNALDAMTGFSGAQIRRIKAGKDPMDPSTPRGRKLAYQVVRLMRTCKELLLTGKVNVWRGDIDAEELLYIKQGGWSAEQVVEFFDKADAELEEISKSERCVIPKEPNRKAVEKLCIEMVEAGLAELPK